MAHILVDSNVLLDVITEDERWLDWSAATLEKYGDDNVLAINPVIYAEISTRYDNIEELEKALSANPIERLPIPWEAAFLAGKCFMQYRKRGGHRTSTLPDFFIGAHATVLDMPLITRDATRYRTYFPKLRIIAPE